MVRYVYPPPSQIVTELRTYTVSYKSMKITNQTQKVYKHGCRDWYRQSKAPSAPPDSVVWTELHRAGWEAHSDADPVALNLRGALNGWTHSLRI